jgi:diacylglycerol kinase family enzyme
VELIETEWIACRPRNGSREALFVEADGEVLGRLPAKLEVVPHSLTLLMPRGVQP